MASIKKFLTTITIQSFGSGAIFLTVFFIARILGPDEQGRFSEVKAFVDLLVVGLLLGLPQSFIYGINRLHIARGQLSRWSMKYGAVAIFLVTVPLWIVPFEQLNFLPIGKLRFSDTLFLALAVAGLIVHGLLRGILLTADDGWRFSFITILPALFLFTAITLLLGTNWFDPILAYAIAGSLSAIVTIRYSRPFLSELSHNSLPWKNLLSNGSTTFVQSIVMAMQPVLTISLLRRAGGGYDDVAFFSLAAYIYQASILPLTMVAPLLFNRWSSAKTTDDVAVDLKTLAWPLIVIVISVGVAWQLAPFLIPVIFGSSYAGATRSIQLILLGVPFMYIGYVGMPALMAIGKFRVNAMMVIVRLITCALTLFFLLIAYPGDDRSEQAAVAWTTAELVMASMVIVVLAKYFYAPVKRAADS
ncbi:hypothetical protein [Noviherbaspirillum sp.]|uniref:lipopolysaccharide biosynthesis protein n=1 Tax=Noviherbaspirillum sp. TaxID=1926288 RepID=UPI002D4FFE16|nr:hypothetical protein [Noviherbaspirillum sp.]HZW21415.1 hypothetical protein [Noviherbaspirillum sp.]